MNAPTARRHNQSMGPPPRRRPYSLRRTSSHQSFWPQEHLGPHLLAGSARDLFTGADASSAQVLASDTVRAVIDLDFRLAELDGSRHADVLAGMAGMRPGGEMRKALAAALPEEGERGTLLFRLLDDLAGAVFLSTAAWHNWLPGGVDAYGALVDRPSVLSRPVLGLCISYAPGSEALTTDGLLNQATIDHPAGLLPFSADDPIAWHPFAQTSGPDQWRLRRTDMWHQDGKLCVDAWFQDSSIIRDQPDRRNLFHEYGLQAEFEPGSCRLLAIKPYPAVLPFRTCDAAPATADRLIGLAAHEFRQAVPDLLGGTRGCTHLNDMLRALQDVAAMAELLDQVLAARADAATG